MAIKRLLIANRGEIACRIINTAKRLGIFTIAVYADNEPNALHCQLSDQAICIGSVPVEKSYLNIAHIIQAARDTQADAIHPGYGFLSENAEFAKACVEAGFIFVGPGASAIASMAIKDHAKALIQKAGVPVAPGLTLTDLNDPSLKSFIDKTGCPLILKATKGGGGKGMRIVRQPSEMAEAFAACQRESLSSFGDASIFIEKYVERARHIEVQIFRDTHGNAVHLFERDCSTQRRHQKVIEEAPANDIPQATKAAMYQAALQAAHAIDYVGAGTIEFLYTPTGDFYFMEMNTRLQVEHPVTEMITDIDCVEWQIRIANGDTLPLKQQDIHQHGHAMEARIYAEDPNHGFLPMTGTIKKIFLPPADTYAYRLDLGIQENTQISIYYDPLLAKMIVKGDNRAQAVQELWQVLNHFHLAGITTNLPLLRNILRDPTFQFSPIDTQYLERQLQVLLPKPQPLANPVLVMTCLIYLLQRQETAQRATQLSSEPNSPWGQPNAWRLNTAATESLTVEYQHEKFTVQVNHQHPFHLQCAQTGLDEQFNGELQQDFIHYFSAQEQGTHHYFQEKEAIDLFFAGSVFHLKVNATMAQELTEEQALEDTIVSPMPGIITQIWVKEGEKVEEDQKLLALEAMKMEHTLRAPKKGTIKMIHYKTGEQVEEGSQLIDFE